MYGTWRCDLQVHVAVQMETRDGVVLAINATCANLADSVCLQLFGAHALSGSDTVSYPFGKGYASILKTLTAGNFNLNLYKKVLSHIIIGLLFKCFSEMKISPKVGPSVTKRKIFQTLI